MTTGRYNEKICAVDDSARASALSADATVFCSRCGAKAHDAASVCDPVQLPESGSRGD